MAKARVAAGGGFAAILYVLKKSKQAGGLWKLYQRLRSRNACKTCALGMGGQLGGMVNEAGRFPEVCKKSVQAQAGDMGKAISEDFFRTHSIGDLEKLSSRQFEELGRLAFPIIAEKGATHFKRLSWDEAHARLAERLRQAPPQEVFLYSSGRSSNEAAFLFQLVGRAYGTANIHNCSFYCHNASSVALPQIYGSSTASVVLEDLEKADLAIVIGANPASNHPRLIRYLLDLRRRGGKVIAINPLKELGLVRFRVPSDPWSLFFGSTISDLYLQPHIGTDIALLKAMLKELIQIDALDHDFIAQHTAGFAEIRADLEHHTLTDLLTTCGISPADLQNAVALLSQAKRGIFMWAMGLTHHMHGVDNVLALGNLALARGYLGKSGCGLMPIRGHSNVQGVGSVGVSPTLKKNFAAKLEELYDIKIPEVGGQDTYASMVAASEGKIQASLILGGNLFSSNPDRNWSRAALQKIPLSFCMTTKLNEGHVWGRAQTQIIVPVLARDEEAQTTTQESMFNFVRLSEGGKPSVQGEMRSEVEIIATIAEQVLPPKPQFQWRDLRSHQRLREEISRAVPGYEKLAEIGRSKNEFQITGRTFHDQAFATIDRKAHFKVTPLPGFSVKPNEFRLMTLRSEGQFNSVVYEEEDLYRGNTRRDVVMMNGQDVERLQLSEGKSVVVETDTGSLRVVVSVADLPPGNLAMYYPEANVLVPRNLDPASKTPAFKSIAVRLQV